MLRLFCFFCIFACQLLTASTLEDVPLPRITYPNEPIASPVTDIAYRAEVDPLNIASTIIFACAVIHILFARRITALSKKITTPFLSKLVHFFGEVEIIFGLWLIPLLLSIFFIYNWESAVHYLNSRDYKEAVAVVIVMTLASTYPIIYMVELIISGIASLGKNSPSAWWLSLLSIGPLFGCFITEAGAMTITSLLLAKHIFSRKPSPLLAYATIGLLFTNVSLGGIATAFASPPALLASSQWNWSSKFMFFTFGWKVILSIIIGNLLYWACFRKELYKIRNEPEVPHPFYQHNIPKKVPFWVIGINLLFLVACVFNIEEPVIAVGIFLFFLGFHEASRHFQSELELRPALLVGFFIASLVIHSGLQEWWIAPLLDSADATLMLVISLTLGPITDNAVLTYLATLIPHLSLSAKYAVMVGAVAAGGLSVIANAPNPAGQQLLSIYFDEGVSPRKLFLGALPASLLALVIFLIFWV